MKTGQVAPQPAAYQVAAAALAVAANKALVDYHTGPRIPVGYTVAGVDFGAEHPQATLAALHPGTTVAGSGGTYTLDTAIPANPGGGVVAALVAQARKYRATFPGLVVTGIAPDWVGVADIAARTATPGEQVRRWVTAAGFPAPVVAACAAGVLVWPWPVVVAWVGKDAPGAVPQPGAVAVSEVSAHAAMAAIRAEQGGK